jgi:hypothetical protein
MTKPSGGKTTAAERQRDRTERLAGAGLKHVKVIVPASREAEIKAIAAIMRGSDHVDSN